MAANLSDSKNNKGSRDEYGEEHDELRWPSLSLQPKKELQDLDDKIVVPILLVEGGKRIVYVSATTPDKRAVNINFEELAVLGEGSFGRVVKASLRGDETRKRITVAIKTVQQDRRFKNRELQFMRTLNHENVVKLMYSFVTRATDNKEDAHPNLSFVMEHFPESLFGYVQRHYKAKTPVSIDMIKLVSFQLFRGLAYIHSLSVCHRDIKPNNILINEETGVVKICDMGSMKKLESGAPNVSYICSRFFRAPELLLGAEHYSVAIDIWSAGCTMAEMFLQRPLFAGKHAHDQLARIMRVLGSPDSAILRKMATELQRPDLVEQECGFLPAKNFADVLPSSAPREASDLLRQMIVYVPSARIRMGMCLSHPFFDAVRSATIILPSGKPCPPLLNFSQTEREYMGTIVSEI